MSAPNWVEPFLQWLTTRPIQTTDLIRIEGNIKHLRDGVTQFSGNKQFANDVEVVGELISRAQAVFQEIVQISGVLTMLGNLTVSPRPGFPGTGNVTVGAGNLNVAGNMSATGTLDVDGAATIGGNADVSGSFTAQTVLQTTMGTRNETSGTITNALDTFVIPAGKYLVTTINPATEVSTFQIRNASGTWVTFFTVNDDVRVGLVLTSDGTNYRVFKNLGSNTSTITLIALT